MPSTWTRRLRWMAMQLARRLHPIVTTRIGRHRVTYTVRDHYIGPHLFLEREWEPALMRCLAAFDLEGSTAIDVGACFGTYTLELSHLVGPRGRVISIEPGPEQLKFLRRNVSQNQLTNVTIVPCAAGARAETLHFVQTPMNFGNGHLVRSGTGSAVSVRPLDAITADLPAGSIHYIKIDVEERELDVLQGMRETLRKNPAVIIQMEISTPRATEVIALLEANGLRGFQIDHDHIEPIGRPITELTNVFVTRDVEDLERRLRA